MRTIFITGFPLTKWRNSSESLPRGYSIFLKKKPANRLISTCERETAVLMGLLKKQLTEIEVPLPEIFRNKSERWKSGFRSGYKSIVSFLKNQLDKNDDELLMKLNEIRENL